MASLARLPIMIPSIELADSLQELTLMPIEIETRADPARGSPIRRVTRVIEWMSARFSETL
jgi:hypothetical protein